MPSLSTSDFSFSRRVNYSAIKSKYEEVEYCRSEVLFHHTNVIHELLVRGLTSEIPQMPLLSSGRFLTLKWETLSGFALILL